MENKTKVTAAVNLLKRLDPSNSRQHIQEIIAFKPEIRGELLKKVDTPLELILDTKKNMYFFKTEFNRNGDSYRSPYSNEFFPPLLKPMLPSPTIRIFEEKAQLLFGEYLKLYYDSGIVNAFFWDKEDTGLAGCIIIRKECEKSKTVTKGVWDSINLVDIKYEGQSGKKRTVYKVTSTVIMEITVENEKAGQVTFSGSLTKTKEDAYPMDDEVDEIHLARIGKLVEEVESNLRSNLENIYFNKTKEIVFNERLDQEKETRNTNLDLRSQLFAEFKTNPKLLKNSDLVYEL